MHLVPRKMPTAPWMRRLYRLRRVRRHVPECLGVAVSGRKISHLGLLPQGQPERHERAVAMVAQANQELFGACTNIGECEAVCPRKSSWNDRQNEPRFSAGQIGRAGAAEEG